MSEKEFRELVRDMRTAQKHYFSTRSTGALQDAKKYERAVDEELKNQTKLEL